MYPKKNNSGVLFRTLRSGLVLTLTGAFLLGCGNSNLRQLEAELDSAYSDKKPEIEPLPEIPPFIPFAYTAEGEDDPFNTSNIVTDSDTVAKEQRPNADRRREPLESYPLDALNMVGTIMKEGVPWVVVKTNDGNALLASIGNYMGQNDGKIKQIVPDEQRVVLQETVLDPAGRWVTRDVEITIDE